jgi:alpha-tubulin suppressor-like RCC1 family protein
MWNSTISLGFEPVTTHPPMPFSKRVENTPHLHTGVLCALVLLGGCSIPDASGPRPQHHEHPPAMQEPSDAAAGEDASIVTSDDAAVVPAIDAGSDAGAEAGSCTDDQKCDRVPSACVMRGEAAVCACPEGFAGDGVGSQGCTCAHAGFSPSCKPWSSVSVQANQGCGISAGALYCWGGNEYGQLGTGDVIDRYVPTRVGDAQDWDEVSLGIEHHTCGIRKGALYCWGLNASAELGQGHRTPLSVPTRVGTAEDWLHVVPGLRATCGIHRGGQVECWGLLADSLPLLDPPVPSDGVYADPMTMTVLAGAERLSLGYSHGCLLRQGEVYCWGNDYFGQVGFAADASVAQPVRVGTDNTWVDVQARTDRTCATRSDGSLWCWGRDFGATPVALAGALPWKTLGAGAHCALQSDGKAYCWTWDGPRVPSNSNGVVDPTSPFPLPSTLSWSAVATTDELGCGIAEDGALWCWGSPYRGANPSDRGPAQVGAEEDWTFVSRGGDRTCGIRGGGIYCWGALREVTRAPDVLPYEPQRVSGESDWQLVSVSDDEVSGEEVTCGIRSQGELYCWGDNSTGQLGSAGPASTSEPMRVGDSADFVAVSTSSALTCAIQTSGALTCWGISDERSHIPYPDGWTSIALSPHSACGLRNGRAYCWGSFSSVLGVGEAGGTNMAGLPVSTVSPYRALTTAHATSCGIEQTGALYCWGRLYTSALGGKFSIDPIFGVGGGTFHESWVPEQIGTATDWKEVDVGDRYGCGLHGNGRIACWGANDEAQLGNAQPGSLVPTDLPGEGFAHLSVAAVSACAIRAGKLYCWGDNPWFELGSVRGVVPTPVATGNDEQ